VPIFSRNPLLLGGESIQTESTVGEAFRAGTYTMYEGLLGATGRREELDFAEGDFSDPAPGEFGIRRDLARLRPLSPQLDPEQARQRLRDNGLDQNLSIPESGIRQQTLEILMDRKRDELRRQTIFDQSTGGSSTVAALTGALAGSFVDPTNIALAFVPVVGEARYAQMLSRAGGVLGRTGVRISVGGAEGLVGLAPVEALNYYAHQQQQSDYNAYDSMIAIAGGAFFGSALHGGAGLLGDAVVGFKPLPPATLNLVTDTDMTLRSGVGQPTQLRVLTPEQYERSIIMERLAENKPVTREQANQQSKVITEFGEEASFKIKTGEELIIRVDPLPGVKGAPGYVMKPEDGGIIKAEINGEVVGELHYLGKGHGDINSEVKEGWRRKGIGTIMYDMAEAIGVDIKGRKGSLSVSESAEQLRAFRNARGENPLLADNNFVESLPAAIRKALEDDPLMPVRPFIAGLDAATQARALRMAVAQAASGRPIDIAPALFSDPKYLNAEQAIAAAQRNSTLVDGADPKASEWAATVKPLDDDIETARAEVAEEEAFVNDMMANGGSELPESFRVSMAEAAVNAKKQGSAARAAAMCMMRTGG